MDPADVKMLAYVAALLASPTVIVASVKAILVFGKLSQSVDGLNDFMRAATAELRDHGERIAALEATTIAPADRLHAAFDRRASE